MPGTFVNLLSGGKGDDYGVMRMIRAYFGEGVLTMNGVSDLQVVQRGAGANQSVDISLGDILIYHETEKNAYYGYVKTVQNESTSVSAADATNPRKDLVVAYIDLSAFDASTPDNEGALKFKCVAGVAAGSPSDPTDPTCQSAVGAGNPWFKLARLNRPNTGGGGNTITNAMIDDIRLASWLNVKAQYIPSGTTIDTPILVSPTYSGAIDGWVAAGEAWTYGSSDTAAGGSTTTNGVSTYTFTIAGDLSAKYTKGMRIKLTQTTVKYFIVTNVAYSAGTTTITIFGGTDYSLVNAAITLPYYSFVKTPVGFPLDPIKWTVEGVYGSSTQNLPVANSWYNAGSTQIAVPIGQFVVGYRTVVYGEKNANTTEVWSTLSTANNSESNSRYSTQHYIGATNPGSPFLGNTGSVYIEETYAPLTAKQSVFLNIGTGLGSVNLIRHQASTPVRVWARCAYL